MIEFNKKLIFRKFFIDNTYFLSAITTLGLIVWVIKAVNFLDYVPKMVMGWAFTLNTLF